MNAYHSGASTLTALFAALISDLLFAHDPTPANRQNRLPGSARSG